MTFKLQFNLDNAAFGEDESTRAEEIRRILKTVSEQVQAGRDEAAILDSNGNRVGAWRITRRCFFRCCV